MLLLSETTNYIVTQTELAGHYVNLTPGCHVIIASLTEVVFTNKWWSTSINEKRTATRKNCTGEWPDVLPGSRCSMCDTDTIKIVAVYGLNHCLVNNPEVTIRMPVLIPDHSTAYMRVPDSIGWKHCRVTAISCGPGTSPWCCEEPTCSWTLFCSASDFKECNTCPPRAVAASQPVHVTVTHSVRLTIGLHGTPRLWT